MFHRSSRGWIPIAAVAWLLTSGCGAPEPFHRVVDGAGGGHPGGGGAGGQLHGTRGGSGGAATVADTGGVVAGSGGSTPGSGGATATGGATETGGRVATGGTTGSSGGATTVASGGRPGSGGAVGTGGFAAASGGASGTGGTPVTVTVLSDDFAQGPGQWTGGDSADWSIVTEGTTQVYKQGTLSNVVRTVSGGDGRWSDLTVEARVKVLAFGGASPSYQAMVCGRFKDTSNYYYVALDSTGKLAIKKNTTATSHTTLMSIPAQIVVDTWYTVKLQIAGTTLKAFLDGALMITTVDSDLATGGVGLGTRDATAEFGAVRVRSP